jgi:hypothetical protein
MQKRIVYSRPDGGMSIVIPSPGSIHADEDKQKWLDRIIAKDVPADATDVQVIETSALPSDQAFRGAWVREGGAVVVDMAKAREIHAATIAVFAEQAQQKLDVLALRGEDVTARRQAIVSAVAALDMTTAETPAELKALWPEGLAK